MYYKADTVREAARGDWLFILAALAPQLEPALNRLGRHVLCPVHGGRDKNGFRLFKDAHETGGGVCNSCDPFYYPDGFSLLMWLNGWNFNECLKAVGDYLGAEKKAPQINPSWLLELKKRQERRIARERAYRARLHQIIERVWNECVPLSSAKAQPMQLYFQSRRLLFKVAEVEKSDSLRFHPAMLYYDADGREVGKFPAIVCAIRDIKGHVVTLHRTYLTQNGKKADVACPKKMMPVPSGMSLKGASIRLGKPTEGILGVAEGIESALSPYRATRIPVWSSVNATLMESFEVPKGVHTVLIWADKDKSGTGQKAANALKARLKSQGISAYVLLPKLSVPDRAKSVDWNDVLVNQGLSGFPNARYLRDFIASRRVQHAS
jgi:phage/plasmid primase-like uncharacterized protein